MNDPKKCETCGAPLQSVDELCSNCLIRAGIDETVVLSDEMILTKDADQNVAHVGEGAWDYEILEEIAQGGMGVVYKARQKKLNRVVALKMLLAGAFARQDVLKRFLSEAEVVAHLDHPNIVPIYEIGRHDGQTFFTMKYIENGTLKESLPSLMAHPRRAVELMVKVVKAVHFAHQRGVLHRDIKPGNILIDAKGEPWVTDFGLAKREGEDVTMTRTGTIMGTPAYMAPEQAKSRRIPLTTSADVYSLGAVLYHLFTGRPPFDAEDPLELLQYVQSDEPPHPKQWNKSLPDDLATICLKCLEKHPARRYASAEVLGQDLERWLAYQPIEARPSGFWERKIKWARRKPSIAALSVLVVLLSVFGLGGLFLQTLQKQAALEKAHQAAMDLATARAPVLTARKVMRHEDRAASLVFSMDGSNILTSSKDTKARVWNAFSGELLLVLEGSNGSLSHAEFSPDESMILTLSIDEGFYYPHLSPMGEPIATWEGPWNGENKVRLWDAKTGEIRHVLEGHSAQVTDARFSPDGQWVVTSSLDKTAVIWESSTGRKMHVLTGHEASVASVEFTPDGQSIATTSMGQVLEVKVEESAAGHRSTSSTNNRAYESELVKFWDLESGKQIGGFRNQVSQVLGGKEVFGNSRCQVQFSNNGRWAVTVADLPDQVGVWDLKKREWIAALEGHHHTVLDAEFSPDGQSVATACADHVARVFSVPDGHLMHLFKSHTAPVLRVDFSSDEKRLLTVSADGTGRLWDLKTGHGLAVLQGHDDRVVDGKFHPNGFHIATASRDHTVRIWESGSLEKMAISFKGHTKRVTQLDWHPDSNHVASGSDDLTARVWSLAQPDRHHMLKGYEKAPNDVVRNRLLGEVRCVAFSPDGNGLWTASNDVDGAFLNILGLPPTKMSFQPARLWDWRNKEILWGVPGLLSTVSEVHPDPSGKYVLVDPSGRYHKNTLARNGVSKGTRWENRSVAHDPYLFDVEKRQLVSIFAGFDRLLTHVCFSPDGRWMLLSDQSEPARIYNLKDGQLAHQLEGVKAGFSASFSQDSKRLFMHQFNVGVWEVESGRQLVDLRDFDSALLGAWLNEDEGEIITVTRRGILGFWNLDSGEMKNSLAMMNQEDMSHKEYRWSRMSPDRRLLAIVTHHHLGQIELWDTKTHEMIASFRAHSHQVNEMAFSPDNQWLATASDDFTVKAWPVGLFVQPLNVSR